METQTKCGDDCKLVAMLASKTPKEQAMENAIEALKTTNITLRGAHKQFKVPLATLSRRWKESCTVFQVEHHTTSKPGAVKSKPTEEERQEWWRLHNEEGLTVNAIHKKTGRNRQTIDKELKKRKDEVALKSGTATQWDNDPCLEGWNGKLNRLAQKIYNREKYAGKQRIDMAAKLAEIKDNLEKTMKAASKDHTVKAGKLLETDVKIVEAKLQKENKPGITDTLKVLIYEAERIQKYASETLRLLQLQDV